MAVIMFITWALKLLFMQIPYILTVFIVLFLIVLPVSANLNKISSGSPIFVGESDVDISAALNGCHSIAWWKNGSASETATPDKKTEIYPLNTASNIIFHYNISPSFFGGSTGTWYCVDKAPYYPVFVVEEPRIDIKVWDLDHNVDVSGKSFPKTTNITYRIDTNLYPVLSLKNRPNKNPDDSPFTVKLMDPRGNSVPSIYTGNAGLVKTVILPFESKPYISESPYYWNNGIYWDHKAKNVQGDPVYPDGTYTFVVSQNLNHMQESYASASVAERNGKTTKTVLVAFEKEPFVATVTEVTKPVTTAETLSPAIPTLTSAPGQVATLPTATPIPKKTTYSPLPEWIGIIGLVIAGIFIIRKKA